MENKFSTFYSCSAIRIINLRYVNKQRKMQAKRPKCYKNKQTLFSRSKLRQTSTVFAHKQQYFPEEIHLVVAWCMNVVGRQQYKVQMYTKKFYYFTILLISIRFILGVNYAGNFQRSTFQGAITSCKIIGWNVQSTIVLSRLQIIF